MSEKIQGKVRVRPKTVRGWAFDENSKSPITVNLYVDDKFVAAQKADQDRKGLVDNGKHATGKCGFKFDFSDKDKLSLKSKIVVKAGKGQTSLKRAKQVKKGAGAKAKAKTS